MTPRLTTDYAKNYCNRTLIVKVIVVTCFFMGHSVESFAFGKLQNNKLWIVLYSALARCSLLLHVTWFKRIVLLVCCCHVVLMLL